jgi:hypothetical protein
MTTFSYLDYARTKEDNMPDGSALDTRFGVPYGGPRINDSFAAMASAIRNLGDGAVKLKPGADEGSFELGPNGGQVGNMAWQDRENVDIEGGRLGPSVRGSIPARVILPWWGPFSLLEQVYPALRTRGFDICDGRTSTNPVNSAQQFIMPNFLDHFIYFYGTGSDMGLTNVFAHVKNTSSAGEHNHGASVGGTSITAAQSPTLSKTSVEIESGDGATALSNVAYGGPGTTHTHSIPTEAAHLHNVDVRPKSVVCVPLMRIW